MPDLTVRPLLQRMLVDILHPHCSYHLYTNYVYRLPNSEPASLHWCHAPLVIDYESLWRAEFLPDSLVCELTLSQQLPQQARRISIPYQQIYRISRRLDGQQTAHSQHLGVADTVGVYAPPKAVNRLYVKNLPRKFMPLTLVFNSQKLFYLGTCKSVKS